MIVGLAGASPATDPAAVVSDAKALAARGNPVGGLQRLEAFLARPAMPLSVADAASLQLEASRIAIAAGRPDSARSHVAAFTARKDAFRSVPLLRAQLMREAARVSDQLGDYHTEEALLTEAIGALAVADPIQAADAANSLGIARLELLRVEGADDALRRGLGFLEHRDAPAWLKVALLANLVNAELSAGRIEAAHNTLTHAIAAAGDDRVLQRQVALARSQVLFWDNDLRGAEEILATLTQPTGDADNVLRGHAALLLATTRFNRGLMPEAAEAAQLAATIYLSALGEWHPLLGRVLHTMGTIDESLGDRKAAVADFTQAADVERHAFGEHSVQLHATEVELGWLDLQRGDVNGAERRAKAALGVFQASGLQDRRQEAFATIVLGLVAERKSQFDDAIRLFQEGQALIRQSRGDRSADLGFSLVRLGRLLTRLGRYDAAEKPLDQAVQLYEQTGAAASLRLAEALAAQAELRARRGDRHGALEKSGHSYAVLHAREALGDQDPAISETFEHYGARSLFSAHARMLLTLSPSDEGAIAEAFQSSQEAMNSRTGDAIRRTTSRLATGNGELAVLLRRWSDDLDALNAAQVQARSSFLTAQSVVPADWEHWQTVIAARSDALRATEAIVASRFPASAELIRPRPVTIDAVRKVLAPDETLLMPLVDDAGTTLWVITANSAARFLSLLTTDELGVLVKNIRRGVDLGNVPEGESLPAFDIAAAKTLYADLVAPASAAIGRRTKLVFIPDGALQTLPLHLLITDDASPEWLASRYAVTVEPSVGALVAARSTPTVSHARSGFLGVGNPEVATAAPADQTRTYQRTAMLRDAIAGLPALPETETELTRMASVFGQDKSKLLLGSAASKSTVLAAMSEPYQAIAFATHAVMAGELPHVSEPAIVLSRGSGPVEDMLLTASEVAASHMDTELVILSACNTASTDGGPFAEGLSGLARSFFHAGARTLLVSDWAVSNHATVALTTGFLQALENRRNMSPAMALQQAMRQMLNSGDPALMHPAAWAPFVVVGGEMSVRSIRETK